MSVVTSITLTVSCCEAGWNPEEDPSTPDLDRVNSFLDELDQAPLAFLTPHYNGGKHPQTYTFGGGYNMLPDEEFIRVLEGLTWENPENVVLVLQPEEGPTIVWRPKDAEPEQQGDINPWLHLGEGTASDVEIDGQRYHLPPPQIFIRRAS